MKNWMTTDEVAEYLGLSRSQVYSLAQDGRIPASRIGKKWAYYRDAVDDWARESRTVEELFQNIQFRVEDNDRLRDPQREGYMRAAEFFRSGGKEALLQLPVGCGKSGLGPASTGRPDT